MAKRYYDITTGMIKYDALDNALIRQTPNGVLEIGGPRGYTGATGATGPKGDKGDKGDQGEPGTFDNAPLNYDFVVDTNIIADQSLPNPWWKKYRSGFIEQGGLVTVTGRSNVGDCTSAINFPTAFTSTSYCALVAHNNSSYGYATSMPCAKSKTTTGMTLGVWAAGSGGWAGGLMSWEVKGK